MMRVNISLTKKAGEGNFFLLFEIIANRRCVHRPCHPIVIVFASSAGSDTGCRAVRVGKKRRYKMKRELRKSRTFSLYFRLFILRHPFFALEFGLANPEFRSFSGPLRVEHHWYRIRETISELRVVTRGCKLLLGSTC